MKRLFSSPDTVEVDLLKSRMETAGFSCEVRNESVPSRLALGAVEHELWILHDHDFPDAVRLLKDWQESSRGKKGSAL